MKRKIAAILSVFILFIAACGTETGNTAASGTDTAEAPETEQEIETEATVSESEAEAAVTTGALYLLTGIDTADGRLFVRNIASGAESEETYSGATAFYDKYGTMTSLASFAAGDVVTLERLPGGVLSAAQLSDQVFSYRDVTDYTLDLSRMVLTFQGSNYRLTNRVPVYTNGKDTGLYSIGDGDSLDITGLEKDILSLTVTTGLGTIELKNIDVFLGGWLNLDNETYLKITSGMKIPASEGTHILTVANDGWGDSTVVAVKRDQTVAVDLSALKGEGPKYCDLTVIPNVEGATVRVDGQRKEVGTPMSVRYGVHLLTVSAEGYDDWQRRLVVNSQTAEIEVDLTLSGSAQSSASSGNTAATETATAAEPASGEGLAGSLAGSQTSGTASKSAAQREAEATAAEAYLDTLTGMLDTLTGTGTSESN